MSADDYNSGLGNAPRRWPAAYRHEGANGEAFVADVSAGIPQRILDLADVLYAEVPWAVGYEKFANRAGVKPMHNWPAFMTILGAHLRVCGKPAIIIAGKTAKRYLAADGDSPCILNGGEAVAYCWRFKTPWPEVIDTHRHMLPGLAMRFDCIGDFCCGYGRSGRIFAAAGKRYVMSDFDPGCIGYLNEHMP